MAGGSQETERLPDEEVARIDRRCANEGFSLPAASAVALAREVQEWRALVSGGPCPTCEGIGMVDGQWNDFDQITERDYCPDCKDGRLPGLIERLEAHAGRTDHVLAAIIADLRSMVTP